MTPPRSARCFAPRLATTMAVVLASIATPAMGEIVDLVWDAGGLFERKLSVAPGKFVEVCGKLPAGLKVRWEFEGNTPVDFNVHYHVGKEVVFPSKLTATSAARDTLATKIEQSYCWMWSNKSPAEAALTVKLQR